MLAGAIVSILAWIRRRIAGLRRERVDEIIDRLLGIVGRARSPGSATQEALDAEVDGLATEAVRYGREREPDERTMLAVMIAIDTARKTIADRHASSGPGGSHIGDPPRLPQGDVPA